MAHLGLHPGSAPSGEEGTRVQHSSLVYPKRRCRIKPPVRSGNPTGTHPCAFSAAEAAAGWAIVRGSGQYLSSWGRGQVNSFTKTARMVGRWPDGHGTVS